MGCDGGTIPRRDEMVKLKKKAEKVRPNVTNLYHWPSIGHNFITPNLVKYKTLSVRTTWSTRHQKIQRTDKITGLGKVNRISDAVY